MKFTQFLFPCGRRVPVKIDMPADIERLAIEVEAMGFGFEIECHPDTQIVHMDCCNEDEQVHVEFVKNGPGVPLAVEKLVRESYAILRRRAH